MKLTEVERKRTLIFTVLLGGSAEIVRNVAGRTGKHWARRTLNAIPMSAIRSINKAIGVNFVTKYGTKRGLIVLGKVVPFGFGAVIGGGLNFVIGQTVVKATQRAFGEPSVLLKMRLSDPCLGPGGLDSPDL